jgi:hypothetical protein
MVDDVTRLIWLTNTSYSQLDTYVAICKTITTELNINCTPGYPTTVSVPSNYFYNIFLSCANSLDITRSKQSGRHQEKNRPLEIMTVMV